LQASATGGLNRVPLRTRDERAVGVVLASRGYPASAESGKAIHGLDRALPDGAVVFHAGTKRAGDDIVTAGGRVLTVVGRGATFDAAMALAYRAVDVIRFDGMQFRHDIGRKASVVVDVH